MYIYERFFKNLSLHMNDMKEVFDSYNEDIFSINQKNSNRRYETMDLSGKIENCKVDIYRDRDRMSRYTSMLKITSNIIFIVINLDDNIAFKRLKIANTNITNINKVYSSKDVYGHYKPFYAWCEDKEYAEKILTESIIETLADFLSSYTSTWEVVFENNLM